MVNFVILLMPFAFLCVATLFSSCFLLNTRSNARKCMSKDSCLWHKPAYCLLFSLRQGEVTKVLFCNQTEKCERILPNRQRDLYLYTESIYFLGASFSDERINSLCFSSSCGYGHCFHTDASPP